MRTVAKSLSAEQLDILWTMTLLPDEIWEGYRNDLRRQNFMVADSVLEAFPAVLAELRACRAQIANLEVRNADLRERLFEADRARDIVEQRDAMLERVVEAARSYADVASHAGAEAWALRVAINAADALRLTESATTHKGNS